MRDLVATLKADGFSIVVVDDGSGEKYRELFNKCTPFAHILHHTKNGGKGKALKTGLVYITEHFEKDAVVVTVDADGQHTAQDALAVCRLAEASPATLVLGSRRLAGDIPLRSRFGNGVTRFIYRIATGLKVHDTQTGLRAFDTALIPALLKISGDRYEYEMNMLLQFARDKVKIVEQEIETIYFNDNDGSHFNALKDSFRIYKEILKFSASSFIGFLVDYAVYSTLILLTNHLRLSNIGARVVSATVNFSINRKFVFTSKEALWKSAVKYFLLAAFILAGNTFVLEMLVNHLSVHRLLAKIFTEILFFVLSWLVQRLVVFNKKQSGE